MSARRAPFITLRSIAIVMAAIEVVIHAYLAPSHLAETRYVGISFILATVGLTAVLISLLRRRTRTAGWVVGALACGSMFVLFLVSRTVGLPGYHEAWTSDHGLGLASLPPELIFIGAALYAVRVRRTPREDPLPLRVHDVESEVEGYGPGVGTLHQHRPRASADPRSNDR